MSVLGATLLVLAGLAIMGFGIFLFYAWLPFLYGLFGLEIGLLLGRWFTGGIGVGGDHFWHCQRGDLVLCGVFS